MNLTDVKQALANPATTPQYRSQAMAALKRISADAANPDSQQAKQMLAKETGASPPAVTTLRDATPTPAQLAAMTREQRENYFKGLSKKRRSELTVAELGALHCPESGYQLFLGADPVPGVELLRNSYRSLVEDEESLRVKEAIVALGGEVPPKNRPIDVGDLLKRN